jgi:hypothetical protein
MLTQFMRFKSNHAQEMIKTVRPAKVKLGALASCIAFYLFGAVNNRHDIFLEPQLISLREKVLPSRYTLDAQNRIIGDAEKPAVACPCKLAVTLQAPSPSKARCATFDLLPGIDHNTRDVALRPR